MRVLIWHVDYFRCEITEKGRSPVVEKYDDPVTEFLDGLLVLASVEKTDEAQPEAVARNAAAEIASLAVQVGARRVLLHSFAHLFGELSRPSTAVKVLKLTEAALREQGLEVVRTPFGWFNTLDIRAKGHPLSRVSRIING